MIVISEFTTRINTLKHTSIIHYLHYDITAVSIHEDHNEEFLLNLFESCSFILMCQFVVFLYLVILKGVSNILST